MPTRAQGAEGSRTGQIAWALLAVLVACVTFVAFGSDLRASEPMSVEIQDSRFLPQTLTVPAGTTVRWVNRDEETHTVTSATGLFGSAGLEIGEAYGHTFTSPGAYQYTCDLHPFMHGIIIVN